MTKFEAIHDLVQYWDNERKPLKKIINNFFAKHPEFGLSEQEYIKKHAYAKIKHFIYLRFFEEYADKKRIFGPEISGKIRDLLVLFVREHSLLDADELFSTHLPQLKPQLNELFIKVKFHFKKFEEDIKHRSPLKKQLYVLYSFSREIVNLWLDQYPEEYVKSLMEGFNSPSSFTIRVNFKKNNRNELRDSLEAKGVFTNFSEISSKMLTVGNPELLYSGEIKKSFNGNFLIQDEGEVLLNQLHFAAPKDLILDLNPTYGNFFVSYALDAHLRTNLHAVCFSQDEKRNMIDKVKPFSLPNLEIIHVNNNKHLLELYENKADVVFVRPKNSGFGRIKSEPDRKWNISQKYLFKTYDKQFQLLNQAAKLVNKGGKIIYITETINKMENETLISKFLLSNKKFAHYKDISFQPQILNRSVNSDKQVFFHPKDYPFGSFFAAVLQKTQ